MVTFAGSREIARLAWRDDGETLTSDIEVGGRALTVATQRSPRRVVVGTAVHELPPGTVALENLDWQAYALLAEQFPDATNPTEVQVYVPSRGATVSALVTVRPAAGGGRVVEVALGPLQVTADVSAGGEVTGARVPAQHLEARLASAGQPVIAHRAAPAGVTEEPFAVTRGGVAIRGSLWRPADATGPTPVVVLVAGSGPTDRDCNGALGLRSDAFRMLAEGLALHGIASVRFDKRGVGESGTNFDAAVVTLGDFVDDAAAVLAQVQADRRFSAVTLAGHSEGGLIALEIAARAHVDALLLLATAGRPLGVVLREQLARHPVRMTDVDRIIAAIVAGTDPGVVAPLDGLFGPAVRPFLRSILEVDPVRLLRAQTTPTTVIQGETDMQVTVTDARALAAARPGVRLTLLPETNHPLKREPVAALLQASYSDPSMPLAPGVLDAVLAGIARSPRR